MLSIHYHSMVSRYYDDAYDDFKGVYNENIDCPFLLYKKYLEIFSHVIFNSVLERILPLISSVFDTKNNHGPCCKRKMIMSIFLRRQLFFFPFDASNY